MLSQAVPARCQKPSSRPLAPEGRSLGNAGVTPGQGNASAARALRSVPVTSAKGANPGEVSPSCGTGLMCFQAALDVPSPKRAQGKGTRLAAEPRHRAPPPSAGEERRKDRRVQQRHPRQGPRPGPGERPVPLSPGAGLRPPGQPNPVPAAPCPLVASAPLPVTFPGRRGRWRRAPSQNLGRPGPCQGPGREMGQASLVICNRKF